jgi:hypothetical protein
MNVSTIKQSYTSMTNSPVAQAWAADFNTVSNDSLRILNATSVAAMRSTALSLRFTSITVETLNVGLGYALDHSPKTYEETKEGISSMWDNIMDMFEEEEEEVEGSKKPSKVAAA